MRVVDEFRRRHGRPPAGVASAPGRVNLIGEHLDYNGGLALPMPLRQRTYVAVAPRDDGRVRVASLQADGTVDAVLGGAPVAGWAAYVVGVLEALRADGSGPGGADVVVDGRVPLGSGLSSSAALEVATCLAALAVTGRHEVVDLEHVVDLCVRVENEYVGAPTGRMDQMAVALSTPDHALLVDFADGSYRPVPWRPPGELLVVDTGVRHSHAGGEYADRRRESTAAAALLGVERLVDTDPESVEALPEPLRRRARHVVGEQRRVRAAVAALEVADWERFGALMQASHESLRDDYEVSCPELDTVVEAALTAGATGARMTGGGFGGCAVVLAPPGGGDEVREAVDRGFAHRGWRTPTHLDGGCGAPARVEVGG